MKLILGSTNRIDPYHFRWVDDTWSKVDKYFDDVGVINMDATALDFPDDSVEAIYASHLLEHFSYRKVPDILKHWYNKLQPEGWLHINVPDLQWFAKTLLQMINKEEFEGKYYTDPAYLIGMMVYGSHEHEGEYHKAGFIKETLEGFLKDAGFVDIEIVQEFEAHQLGCLIADAYKP